MNAWTSVLVTCSGCCSRNVVVTVLGGRDVAILAACRRLEQASKLLIWSDEVRWLLTTTPRAVILCTRSTQSIIGLGSHKRDVILRFSVLNGMCSGVRVKPFPENFKSSFRLQIAYSSICLMNKACKIWVTGSLTGCGCTWHILIHFWSSTGKKVL